MAGDAKIDAVVCIPTFRRPDWLARTLKSLAEQAPGFGFAIVVVDNDARDPLGAKLARDFFSSHDLPNAVFVEENQGNCFAINRAFGEALDAFPEADCFLMIDDDEIALPGWLAEMVGLARETCADIVGGPVFRVFEGQAPQAIRQHQ
ncbi:glycosyltransferase family 2 protein, partial [Roseibium sp.]|uniref:glycosyltransferase family 2 protein n=1 Tax=Roseibium sp. TaxID=1936156 RepID=UPI003D0A2692